MSFCQEKTGCSSTNQTDNRFKLAFQQLLLMFMTVLRQLSLLLSSHTDNSYICVLDRCIMGTENDCVILSASLFLVHIYNVVFSACISKLKGLYKALSHDNEMIR